MTPGRSDDIAAPILFIHYGPAAYLRWTLDCARRTNPEKRVVLLGDASNRKYARPGIGFVAFEDFLGAEKIRHFDRVFQVVQGERHRFHKHGGVEKWLRFVFVRWFLIEEYLKAEGIDSFWTFDSDTLILDGLGEREGRFTGVEATTQCRGQCLNGWVGSRSLVERYTDCMIELFENEEHLEWQRERLRRETGLAFNEMDAFAELLRRDEIPTCRASDVVNGEAFDDALAFVEDYVTADERVRGRNEVKRLWTTSAGGIFAKLRSTSEMVRLVTCNMSWMPDYLYGRIIKYGLRRSQGGRGQTEFFEVPLAEPLSSRLWRRMRGGFALRS